MSTEFATLRRQLREIKASNTPHIGSYNVTLTESGKWLHAPGSDFLFAFLEDQWPADLQTKVTQAFEDALTMSTSIKNAVKQTSGQDVVDGLYLLDQPAMTKAMNSIDGMGQTQVNQQHQDGYGVAVDINGQFFAAILGGLSGDVAPMLNYLTTGMGDVQAQTKKSTVTKDFGTVIGLISVMPILNVPVTSFQYVYSTSEVSTWFVKVNCASVEKQSYDYGYTVVNYNYSKPK